MPKVFLHPSVFTGTSQDSLDAKERDHPDPPGRVDTGQSWRHEGWNI